jgi:hypothetical protein
MHEPRLEQMLHRLQAVEQANRWWKAASLTVMALLGLVVWLGAARGPDATRGEEVRATRLILVDPQGRPLGRLGVEADGIVNLLCAELLIGQKRGLPHRDRTPYAAAVSVTSCQI